MTDVKKRPRRGRGQGTAYQRGSRWWIAYTDHRGRRVRKSLGAGVRTRTEAEERLAVLIGRESDYRSGVRTIRRDDAAAGWAVCGEIESLACPESATVLADVIEGIGVNGAKVISLAGDDLDVPIRWLYALVHRDRVQYVGQTYNLRRRIGTQGAAWTIPVRMKKDGVAGVFLDPPYADTARRAYGLYAADSFSVAHDVREWCIANGGNPKWRIVLAGFEGEHGTALTDAGWRELEWFRGGYLAGGMGNTNKGGKKHQQHRERFWASPHCLPLDGEAPTDVGGTGELFVAEEVQP